MDNKNAGVIYILTNPSFKEYVKIGYADDVVDRVKHLNRSECTPFGFRIYATYEVPVRLTDMKLHSIIDRLNPELRSIDNIDGKKRVREFYNMSKEDAYAIFEAIAEIDDRKQYLHLWEQTEREKEEEKLSEEYSKDEHIEYSEEYHLEDASDQLKDLYSYLKEEIRKLDNFEILAKKIYIAFKVNKTNIFDLQFAKYKLKIWINMPKGELKDPKEFTRDVSSIGHHGNGDYELTISSKEEVPYLIELIKQSLNFHKK